MENQGDLPYDHAFVELLVAGPPSDANIQQLLRDTEEKLKLNACSIEQTLKELQAKMGDSIPGERVPSPTDCLQWFSPRNLGALKPLATGHQDLLDFLRALQQYLRAEEGREEAVLQLLLDISSQCGVAFPTSYPTAAASPDHPPGAAVCAAQDDGALEVQEAWDDLRLRLRRHLLAKLQPKPGRGEGPEGDGETPKVDGVSRRVLLLQRLSFLYPESEALRRFQNLQQKAVLGLLRSSRGCSPVGEKGFDRLALRFESASPALQAMIQEDIQVLNAVTEPHCILAFLNQVYLRTVAQELSALMEKEVETALKDNTAPAGKGGKSSAKGKSAVAAPREPTRRERPFCLTLHQLRCLTHLASTLLELERKVEDIATQLGFLNCAGEAVCGVRGILKKAREDMEQSSMDGKMTPDLLLQNTEAVCLEFDWRLAFHEIAHQMAHCLRVVLEDVCTKSLQQEAGSLAANPTPIALSDVPQRKGAGLTGSERESPKRIAKFCGDVMEELDALLVLASVCKDDVLLPVRSCFVEVCGRVTSDLLTRLEERAREVPAKAPFQILPPLLASSVYVQQRLGHYDSQLRDSTHTPLSLLPLRRGQEVTASLIHHLSSYCIQVCSCSLLQDAQSHHWPDPKPFYEGERCSFSIQMWHYFLAGLRSDLWAVLPPAVAQEILAQVLLQTLEVLVQRYSRARPSYKRLPQIRCDIAAILLCVEQLMWSVCDSVSELVRPDRTSGSRTSYIHSLCEQLVSILVIVTSPLPELCRALQPDSAVPDVSSTQVPLWLNVINPALFPEDSLRDGGRGRGSSLWLLKLLTSGPCRCSPALLLQTLLHQDGLLLQTLLQHSHFCLDSEEEVSAEAQQGAEKFMQATFSVLSSLNNLPKALTLALEAYLDKRQLWDHLFNLADPSREEPVLIGCIRAMVTQPTTVLLAKLVGMVQACDDRSDCLVKQDLPESCVSKVPKEWNYTHNEAKLQESSKSTITLALQALSFIFTHLPSAVSSLAPPLRTLFTAAEKRLSQHARLLRPTGLLPCALLGCLSRALEDAEAPERASGRPLRRADRERLGVVAECLRVSLGQQRGVPKATVHKALRMLEERRPKWASGQMQKARKLSHESGFEQAGPGPHERGASWEVWEQKLRLALLEQSQKEGGKEELRHICCTIRLNQDLLRAELTNPSAESPAKRPLVVFPPAGGGPSYPSPPFNPLVEFDHIGHNRFDQAGLSERDWDWARLLASHRAISQLTLQTLLGNRWEMQDGAALEDDEKALVDQLRSVYLT